MPKRCSPAAAAASEAADLFAAAGSAAARTRGPAAGGGDRAVGPPGPAAVGRRRRRPATCAATDDDFGITAREFEVLELLARGWTNKQIAESLFISEKTARVHVSHLLTKLASPPAAPPSTSPIATACSTAAAETSLVVVTPTNVVTATKKSSARMSGGVGHLADAPAHRRAHCRWHVHALHDHAVVLGASMAGLLTAQALSAPLRSG